MKQCSQCAEDVRDSALVCPHCQHRFSSEEIEEGRAAEKRRHYAKFFFAAVATFGVMYWLDNGGLEEVADTLIGVEQWAGERGNPER